MWSAVVNKKYLIILIFYEIDTVVWIVFGYLVDYFVGVALICAYYTITVAFS